MVHKTTRRRFLGITAAAAGLSLVASGCGQVGMLQAKMAFRDANTLYSGQDYRGAAAKYEEAITLDPEEMPSWAP